MRSESRARSTHARASTSHREPSRGPFRVRQFPPWPRRLILAPAAFHDTRRQTRSGLMQSRLAAPVSFDPRAQPQQAARQAELLVVGMLPQFVPYRRRVRIRGYVGQPRYITDDIGDGFVADPIWSVRRILARLARRAVAVASPLSAKFPRRRQRIELSLRTIAHEWPPSERPSKRDASVKTGVRYRPHASPVVPGVCRALSGGMLPETNGAESDGGGARRFQFGLRTRQRPRVRAAGRAVDVEDGRDAAVAISGSSAVAADRLQRVHPVRLWLSPRRG